MTLSFSTKWPIRMQSCSGQENDFIRKIWNCFVFPDDQEIPDEQQLDLYWHYNDIHKEKFGTRWFSNSMYIAQSKIHTIRRGHRWRSGMNIHMVINNRTANRFQFAPVIQCMSVQDIEIKHTGYHPNYPLVMVHNGKHLMNPLGYEEISRLAINDGFDSTEHFFEYFNEDFEGQIIHWTPLRY